MRLSEIVDEDTAKALRQALESGDFPGITFQQAMAFLKTDGLFPESGLPVESFLRLEEWARARAKARAG